VRKLEKFKKHWVTTLGESGSSQNAGLMNRISQKVKNMTANETRSQASGQEAQMFFSLGGGAGGRGREKGLKFKC